MLQQYFHFHHPSGHLCQDQSLPFWVGRVLGGEVGVKRLCRLCFASSCFARVPFGKTFARADMSKGAPGKKEEEEEQQHNLQTLVTAIVTTVPRMSMA
eukprot:4627280-Amphidinium_carterae.1